MTAAVWAQRSSGLEMIASSRTWASRSAAAAAWARPRSSSGIPGVRPDSAVPVAARTRIRRSEVRGQSPEHSLARTRTGRLVAALRRHQPQRRLGQVTVGVHQYQGRGSGLARLELPASAAGRWVHNPPPWD